MIPVPEEDVLPDLDEEPLAGADEVQRGACIQGMPGHIMGGVGDLPLREKLPRLGAGGSPLAMVEAYGLHGRPPEQNSPLAGGPEGWHGHSGSNYRS